MHGVLGSFVVVTGNVGPRDSVFLEVSYIADFRGIIKVCSYFNGANCSVLVSILITFV